MDATKDRMLEAAARLFAARGYEAVGVQELCESSAVTKPTMYYHFGSKEGLLVSLFAGRFGSFLAALRPAFDYGARKGDLGGVLSGAMKAFLAEAAADPDFARIRLASAFAPPSSDSFRAARPHIEALYAMARDCFVAASLDHGNMKGRDLPYAASFIGTADAYVGLFLAGGLDPDDQFIGRVVHQFMHGIFS